MTNPEGGIPSMASALAGEISKGSIWYVVLGVVLALTGIVLIANPLLGGMALTMLVAILFIVNGGMYLVNAFMARSGGLWLYVSAIALVIGAEYNVERVEARRAVGNE